MNATESFYHINLVDVISSTSHAFILYEVIRATKFKYSYLNNTRKSSTQIRSIDMPPCNSLVVSIQQDVPQSYAVDANKATAAQDGSKELRSVCIISSTKYWQNLWSNSNYFNMQTSIRIFKQLQDMFYSVDDSLNLYMR